MGREERKIAVIGLGYVGLPLALAFAKKFTHCVGFDINQEKIALLKRGIDPNNEGMDAEVKSSTLRITSDPAQLSTCDFFVVGVPTPIDEVRNPDLGAVLSACDIVGKALRPGAIVVFESTVYPGVTEEICAPRLEQVSGLRAGSDFRLGYSPERINPGDHEHSLERVVKVVSADSAETLEIVADVYGTVVDAGVHRAPSIKVAEAAKVIENTQRDLNIALMNELAIIFDRLNISTTDVLAAAATKWNFLRFTPGLVGGHCIGVDPYYLTMKAEQVGYHPQVILAGRRINDGMGAFIAQRTVKMLIDSDHPIKRSKVGILGLTFKENVTDIRNSRVPDIVKELRAFGIDPLLYDPHVSPDQLRHEYGLELSPLDCFTGLDGLIVAVAHREFVGFGASRCGAMLKDDGVLVDVKSLFRPADFKGDLLYWSL